MIHKLSNHQCLAYAVPVVTTAWLMTPIGVVQGIYAKYYGLSLTTIASVLLLVRLFDAVTDPLIGYYADRYYQRAGTYKPFILIGGLLFIISSYFLYAPPVKVGALYFTVWFLAFYFAWTLFEMPHLAWASELAHTSETKTRIYSFRNIANYTGWLLFYSIPLLPIFATRAITPETLRISVMVAAILMVPFLVVCLKTKIATTHEPNHQLGAYSKNPDRSASTQQQSIYPFLQSVITNKPLLIFISAFLMIGISAGMWYSLIFLYVDVYLILGDQFAQMFLFAFAIGIAATPVWYKLSIWWGKKTTWALSTLLLIGSFIYTGLLSPENTDFTKLVVLKSIQTIGFTYLGIVAPAMLSEIIDFSNWKYCTEKKRHLFRHLYLCVQNHVCHRHGSWVGPRWLVRI